MLRQGDSGPNVEVLQRRLEKAGFDPGGVDGIFGPKTDAAVRAFQEAEGLQVDGIFGPNSEKSLMSALMRLAGSDFKASSAPEKDEDSGGATPL